MNGWVALYVERLHRRLAEHEGSHHRGSRCRWCVKPLEGVHFGFSTPTYCSAECRDEWTRALRRRGRPKPRARRRARG